MTFVNAVFRHGPYANQIHVLPETKAPDRVAVAYTTPEWWRQALAPPDDADPPDRMPGPEQGDYVLSGQLLGHVDGWLYMWEGAEAVEVMAPWGLVQVQRCGWCPC